ncbi:MAG: hypothetical protein MR971_00330 [Bacteroidales bacterium]|nr:hypothetical protein [Bacteroidales bacterium]
MKRRFISALLFGALLIAPSSTFVGCSDYDDDIASLQEQINTGATNLDDLVKDKVSNMEKEIAALKATQGDLEKALEDATKNLEEAYKAADGDIVAAYKAADAEMYKQSVEAAQKLVDDALKSMEDALAQANARIDACEAADATLSEKIENLLTADATMTVAIQKAQADAEKAYQLAEQAKATADNAMAQAEANAGKIADLESEYKALADDLKAQAETLATVSSDLDGVNKALKAEISALSEKVENLSKDLASQNASLTAQMGALEEKLNQLMGQEPGESDVPNLKKEIEDLTTKLGALQKQVTANEQALAGIIDAQIKAVTNGLDSRLGALENKLKDKEILQRADIKSIIDEYLKAENGVSEQLSTLNTSVSANATEISKLSKRIDAISGLVQALYTDLSNLITGLIVQDAKSDFQAVYDKMNQYATNPGGGKVYYESYSTDRTLYFPYKGAVGVNNKMKKEQYNVERNAGKLYVTINPNTVDFEGQNLSLVNSKDVENSEYELLPAVKENGKVITTASRATGTAANNGLYAFAIQNNFNDGSVFTAPKTADNVLYAVAASYDVSDPESERDPDTNLPSGTKTRKVYSRYEIQLNAVKAVRHTDAQISLTGVNTSSAVGADYLFSSLSGTLKMNVDHVSNGIITSNKVFAKYVECVKAVNSNGVESADAKAAANKKENAAGIQTVLFEDDDRFNDITVTIPNEYNGYTFTFDYYVWNYDGSIYKVQKSFTFHKPLIEEAGPLSLSHTPTASGINVATEFDGKQFNELNSMSTQRQLWESETKKVDIKSDNSGFTAIDFLNASGASVLNVPLSGGNASNIVLTTGTLLRDIKSIKVSYNPADLALGTVYPITLTFKNTQYNTVSVVTVNFTMKRPTSSFVQFIPASIVEGTENKFIAWAQLDDPTNPTCAQFNFIHNAVNPRFNSTSGTRQKFQDPTNYLIPANSALLAYQPASQNIYETATGALMQVPFKAVQDEYTYNINAGVEFFGVASLWQGDAPMKLQWKSPVKYAVKDHINDFPGSLHLDIAYPGTKELTSLTAVDPSKPSNTVQILGNTVDNRIASIEFDDASNPQNANYGLIASHEVQSNGSGYKLVFATVNAGDGSIQKEANLVYNVKVTDKFGCTQNFVVTVTVKPNLRPSSAPRK